MTAREKTKGKHSLLQVFFLASAVLILVLTGIVFFVGNNIVTIKDLSVSASELLVKWNALNVATQDILLGRSDPPIPEAEGLETFRKDWISKAQSFDALFGNLREGKKLAFLKKEWRDKMDSALALWTITYEKLIAADKDLGAIIASGLGAKVFPGLIYNYYSKRGQRDLSFDEIVLLMNFTNKITILTISGNEFNSTVNEIADAIHSESNAEIRRIIALSLCLLILFLVTIAVILRIQEEYAALRAEKGILEEDARNRAVREWILGTGDADGQVPAAGALGNSRAGIDPEAGLALILLRVNRFSEFCANHSKKDRDRILSSALRLAGNVADRRSIACVGVDFEQHLALVLNPPGAPGDEATREVLKSFALEIAESLARNLDIRLSATACLVRGDVRSLGDAYVRAVQASNYRFTLGSELLIWADAVGSNDPESYEYPLEREKALCNAIKSGKSEEARAEYQAITRNAARFSYNVAQSTVLRIALAVSSTIELIEKSHNTKILADIVSLVASINGLETLDEVDMAFYDVFRTVTRYLDETRKDRHTLIIGGVNKIIEANYRNPNLSIDLIADELRLSASYIGRVYRKLTSKSVAEAINEKRLTIATALLVEKDCTISEITTSIGITNSAYFYTLFKRTYGLTPNEYRRNILPAN